MVKKLNSLYLVIVICENEFLKIEKFIYPKEVSYIEG